jgi:hypothetical protein
LALLVAFSTILTSCETKTQGDVAMRNEIAIVTTGVIVMEPIIDTPPPQQSIPAEIIIRDNDVMGKVAITEPLKFFQHLKEATVPWKIILQQNWKA